MPILRSFEPICGIAKVKNDLKGPRIGIHTNRTLKQTPPLQHTHTHTHTHHTFTKHTHTHNTHTHPHTQNKHTHTHLHTHTKECKSQCPFFKMHSS